MYLSNLHDTQVQTAVDKRTLDKVLLMRVTTGLISVKIASRLLSHAKMRVEYPIQMRLKQFYSVHLFNARARLDVPTFDDEAIQRQLDTTNLRHGQSVAWTTLSMLFSLASALIRLVSQVSIVWQVLRNQPDGPLLAALSLIQSLSDVIQWQASVNILRGGELHLYYSFSHR